MIYWKYRGAPEGNYNQEKRTCTVNALSCAGRVPWNVAHDALRAAGRKTGRGFHSVAAIEAGKIPGFRFERWPLRPDLKPDHPKYFKRVTLKRFVRDNPVGAFFVRMREHAFAVVDGTVYDFAPKAARTTVTHAYKVSIGLAQPLPPLPPHQAENRNPRRRRRAECESTQDFKARIAGMMRGSGPVPVPAPVVKAGRLHLRRAAEHFGATVEDDSGGRWTVLQVVAPAGKLWADNYGVHIKVEWPAGEQGNEPIRDAINRIAAGLVDDTEGLNQ